MSAALLIGIISDTHGALPAAACEAFVGVDHIIHAGDIGSIAVLCELEAIAPVTAVLGNTDIEPYPSLRSRASVTLAGCVIEVVHDLQDVRRQPIGSDTCVLVTGHTHTPYLGQRGAALHVNPGSPVHPRGGNVPTVALLSIDDDGASARLVRL